MPDPEAWSGYLALLLYSAATTLRVQRWSRSDLNLSDGGWAARSCLWRVAELGGVVDCTDHSGRRREATSR